MHPETGLIDFDELRKTALVFRPAMILCGASAYPRIIDFGKFREIADEVGAILMAGRPVPLTPKLQHELVRSHLFQCVSKPS